MQFLSSFLCWCCCCCCCFFAILFTTSGCFATTLKLLFASFVWVCNSNQFKSDQAKVQLSTLISSIHLWNFSLYKNPNISLPSQSTTEIKINECTHSIRLVLCMHEINSVIHTKRNSGEKTPIGIKAYSANGYK